MKRFLQFSFGVLVALFFMVGCAGTQPNIVKNFNDSQYFKKGVSLNRMERAIRAGASRKGWRTRKIKDGLIKASITVRGKYFASVNINYDRHGYRISYADSRNLKFNPADNSIHPSYNKWVGLLEKNINYELSNIDMYGSDNSKTVKVVKKRRKKVYGKNGSKLNLKGKTIYIRRLVSYAPHSRVASNIKKECTLPKALAESIVKSAQSRGIKIRFKDRIARDDIELRVEIDEAVSAGNAFVGHNKYVVVSGFLTKRGKRYYSFDAARLSGGGYFGAYRSSCSVLGRIAKALGKDISLWLSSPYDEAMLGDTGLIRE